jgi:hypothetical protein
MGVLSVLIPAGSTRGGDTGPGGATCNSIVGVWFGGNAVDANNATVVQEKYCASEAEGSASIAVIAESGFVAFGIAALIARVVYYRNGRPDDGESESGLAAGTF